MALVNLVPSFNTEKSRSVLYCHYSVFANIQLDLMMSVRWQTILVKSLLKLSVVLFSDVGHVDKRQRTMNILELCSLLAAHHAVAACHVCFVLSELCYMLIINRGEFSSGMNVDIFY